MSRMTSVEDKRTTRRRLRVVSDREPTFLASQRPTRHHSVAGYCGRPCSYLAVHGQVLPYKRWGWAMGGRPECQ